MVQNLTPKLRTVHFDAPTHTHTPRRTETTAKNTAHELTELLHRDQKGREQKPEGRHGGEQEPGRDEDPVDETRHQNRVSPPAVSPQALHYTPQGSVAVHPACWLCWGGGG